jgi:ParB-like chromosome segregation protein Spo0J
MRTKKAKIETLFNDPANVRKHDQRNIDAIKASLIRFGQQKPIVVNGDGVVIAGNGTLAAAKDLGWKDISTVETELDGVDATAYAIADNRTAELAIWDDDALAQTLASLQNDDSIDELVSGFNEQEIEDLIGKGIDDIEEDEVPELSEEAITQVGDLWLLGAYYECDDCGKIYDYDEGKKMKDCSCG